ncbi:MAG TPA: hypothetical protein VH371_08890 [Candidatus Limnocylindrales bacterium]
MDWKQIPTRGGVTPHWSPDGSYLLLEERDVYGLVLVDAIGQLIARFDGYAEPSWLNDGAWLTDTEFVAYKESTMPSNPHHEVDVPAIIVNARDGTTRDVSFPCCSALANGHGAAAVSWFEPSVRGVAQPEFSVWSDGTTTNPLPRFPMFWTPAGDTLVVEHPNAPGGLPYGWMEALGWPGLKVVLEGEGTTTAAPSARFSPSGAYLTPATKATSDNQRPYLGVLELASGNVAEIPTAGNHTSYGWDSRDDLLVSDDSGLTTYSPDGSRLATEPFSGGITGSADGSTQITFDSNNVPSLWPSGDTIALPAVPDNQAGYWLSPTGADLLAAPADSGFWLAQLP